MCRVKVVGSLPAVVKVEMGKIMGVVVCNLLIFNAMSERAGLLSEWVGLYNGTVKLRELSYAGRACNMRKQAK